MSGGRKLAELVRPVEAETPYGGRVVSYESIGIVWLETGPVRRRERSEADEAWVVETMRAETRSDPRLEQDLVLRFGGGDWTIAGLDEAAPGRIALSLERGR